MPEKTKAKLYTRYPLSSVFIYNGSTILHFLLGGTGIALGYSFSTWAGYAFGAAYLVLAFAGMYVLMPLKVCPNCVYYKAQNSQCVSGLNIISKRITQAGDPNNFARRAEGLLCPNNLYLAALMVPILAIIPALVINFSIALLSIFVVLVGLLLFRFFVIFPKIACLHCAAKFKCPQAGQMGVRNL